MDNATCHPKDGELESDDGMIVTICLPAKCTAILQPMDQNVINLTKLNYKKSLLAHLVANQGSDLETKIKAFNLRHAECLLANAWDKVQSTAIQKCWNPLMNSSNDYNEDDLLPLSVIRD